MFLWLKHDITTDRLVRDRMTPLVMSKPNRLVTTKKITMRGPSISPVQTPKNMQNMAMDPTLKMAEMTTTPRLYQQHNKQEETDLEYG